MASCSRVGVPMLLMNLRCSTWVWNRPGAVQPTRDPGVEVMLDEGDAAGGEEAHQLLFFRVGHAAAERVAVIEAKNTGRDGAGIQAPGQFLEADALAREGGDFAGLHAERLDDLEDAGVEMGRAHV